jgi:hypothetical protein
LPLIEKNIGFGSASLISRMLWCPNFENADQVLKYVILRSPTSKLLFRTQQPADEESHVSKGSVCFFAVLVQN